MLLTDCQLISVSYFLSRQSIYLLLKGLTKQLIFERVVFMLYGIRNLIRNALDKVMNIGESQDKLSLSRPL